MRCIERPRRKEVTTYRQIRNDLKRSEKIIAIAEQSEENDMSFQQKVLLIRDVKFEATKQRVKADKMDEKADEDFKQYKRERGIVD